MPNKRGIAVLLSASMALGMHARAAPRGIYSQDLNRNVQACSDFYEYANGSWRAENPIPPSLPKWSRKLAAQTENWHRQQQVLELAASGRQWARGSAPQIAGDYYASCMDESAVEIAGTAPLASLMMQIDQARTSADVERNIRRLNDMGIPVAIAGASTPGYRDPLHIVEEFGPGALGLPDRNHYLGETAQWVEARERFEAHVAAILALSGMAADQARTAAIGIMALERGLAEASLDGASAADPAATDHMLSFEQLKTLAPHFDWEAYFDEAQLPRSAVNVKEPRFLQQLDKALSETPVATWNAYLKWQLLDAASPYLPRRFAQESSNAVAIKPRAQTCVETTAALFGDALGQQYVKAYFPPAAKAQAQAIVRNLRLALREKIMAVQWMAPQTKKTALAKLDATDVQVGYPNHWRDYSGVNVQRDSLWNNAAAGRRFNVSEERRKVGKPTPRDFWLPVPTPADTSGYLIVELNKMVLPAGALQPPLFTPDATDAVNYGSFGITIAHDLTHFIDSLGAANDLQGYPSNWWTDADRKEFDRRSQCVVDQFDHYFVEPGVHHDGRRVLSEAIADLAGVQIAYAAMRHSMKTHPVPIVEGFTPEQQFFIAWGQSSGAAMRPAAQRELLESDPHPAPKFRVIGPLSNSPEFQKAFACSATDAMARAEDQRCHPW